MKKRWVLGLLGVLLVFSMGLIVFSTAQANSPVRVVLQAAAPTETPIASLTPENPYPRPPSEAGENYSLIAGAGLLVAVVAAGILVSRRQRRQ